MATYINRVDQFNKALADGQYAWPGGYQMYFITSDGAALSYKAAEENATLIRDAIIDKSNDGWQVVACDINYEDTELYCEHTGDRIPSSYEE
jgi:hypothetical protein